MLRKENTMGKRTGMIIASAICFAAAMPLAAVSLDGYENGNSPLDITMKAHYASGSFNVDGGVMEIVAYNKANGFAYAVNGQDGVLASIDITKGEELSSENIDVKALIDDDGFVYGDMTSVAVSPDGSLLALALQDAEYDEDGRIAFFDCSLDGSIMLRSIYETGVQPDMITFSPDGKYVLTADEGEPREGYSEDDPEGSVTVVSLQDGISAVIGFDAFDNALARKSLADNGVVLQKGTDPSEDFEPEYIAVSGSRAYITLQEANAIAVLDLDRMIFTGIHSIGYEDYSKVPVDIDKKDDGYNPRTYETLRGVRMPDAIACFTVDGTDYIVTANEGDAREWGDYLNEDERDFGDGDASPSGAITAGNSGLDGKVVFLASADYEGLDSGLDYIYGGRSMTIFRVSEDGLEEVFTTADDAERITYSYLPDYYNASNDNAVLDDRSGKKGPEAEAVTVGKIDGRIYAFLALERTGGIMVYDVTDPENSRYVNYINTRDFGSAVPGSEIYEDGELDKWVTGGDVAPEGLAFVSAEDSPSGEALLIAAFEVSGTVAVYSLD